MPSRVLSSFSIGLTSNLVPSSGDIPSSLTIVITTGKTTFGDISIGIETREPTPERTTKIIIAMVALECDITNSRNFIV